MRQASNSTTSSADTGLDHWNSPIPYLFGGLALMLGLIAMALAILACSYRRSSSLGADSASEAQDKEKQAIDNKVVDVEPKVVVIMAGDENPTYLAKPVSCSCPSYHHRDQQAPEV